MFAWLRGPSKIDKAIIAGEYPKAIELLRHELARDPGDDEARHLRQTIAELMAKSGQKEEAIRDLRELMNEYSRANMHGKAIGIHKLMWDIDIKITEKVHDDVAKNMLDQIKPLDLVAVGEDEDVKLSERVTAKAAHAPLFGGLSREEVRAVVQGLKLQTKEAGDIVTVEGEPGDSLFILTDGEVRIHVRGKSGKSSAIRDLDSGSFFGEISVVYGKPRTATITCRTPCELLELDRASLTSISATYPGVEKVLKEFCEKRMQSEEEKEGRKK